ncbi:MAG: four helix bundle protein [Vicinamibacterales bacterium]
MSTSNGDDIRRRSFDFGCKVVGASLTFTRPGAWRVFDQLVASATSVGANLEEAKAASSRREFIRYCEISLREARESLYWLRVCLTVSLLPPECGSLRDETDQIVRILTTIVLRSKTRS